MFHLPRNGDYANSLKVSIVRCIYFFYFCSRKS